jgi:hypothetical protein
MLSLTPGELTALLGGSKAKPGKYRNQRTTQPDGQKFDSRAEARRHAELSLAERAGAISELRRQVRFELVPGVRLAGAKRASPAIDYVADWTYLEGGRLIVEDCKGAITDVYRMKRHMMKALLGLDIRETRARQ